MELHSAITQQTQRLRPDWNIIDWRAGDLAKFDTTVRMSYETGDVGVFEFTKTIVQQPVLNGTTGGAMTVPKLRITNESALTGGNTRQFYPILNSDCINGEMRVMFLNRYRVGSSQCGLALRNQVNPSNSNMPRSYHMWHDGVVGQESLMNSDTWERNASTGALIQGVSAGSAGGNSDFPGCQVVRTVNFGSKIGTLITLNLEAGHGVVTGDSLRVVTDEVDEYVIAVTGTPTSTTITLTAGAAAANPIYNVGSGLIYNRTAQPMWAAARLIDNIFQTKAWPLFASEPDWENNRYSTRMVDPRGAGLKPEGFGRMGVTAAHLTTQGQHFVDYGTIAWRSLD